MRHQPKFSSPLLIAMLSIAGSAGVQGQQYPPDDGNATDPNGGEPSAGENTTEPAGNETAGPTNTTQGSGNETDPPDPTAPAPNQTEAGENQTEPDANATATSEGQAPSAGNETADPANATSPPASNETQEFQQLEPAPPPEGCFNVPYSPRRFGDDAPDPADGPTLIGAFALRGDAHEGAFVAVRVNATTRAAEVYELRRGVMALPLFCVELPEGLRMVRQSAGHTFRLELDAPPGRALLEIHDTPSVVAVLRVESLMGVTITAAPDAAGWTEATDRIGRTTQAFEASLPERGALLVSGQDLRQANASQIQVGATAVVRVAPTVAGSSTDPAAPASATEAALERALHGLPLAAEVFLENGAVPLAIRHDGVIVTRATVSPPPPALASDASAQPEGALRDVSVAEVAFNAPFDLDNTVVAIHLTAGDVAQARPEEVAVLLDDQSLPRATTIDQVSGLAFHIVSAGDRVVALVALDAPVGDHELQVIRIQSIRATPAADEELAPSAGGSDEANEPGTGELPVPPMPLAVVLPVLLLPVAAAVRRRARRP